MPLVEIKQFNGNVPVTVFNILDRVNLGNYKELEQTAREEFDKGMRNLVLDLSKTESLTSIGIRAVVVIHKMLNSENGMLKLAGVSQPIQDMLKVAGITQFLEIHDTVEAAVASF